MLFHGEHARRVRLPLDLEPGASRILTTAPVTSGPMPSPGISVMVCFTMNAFTDRLLPTAYRELVKAPSLPSREAPALR